MLRDASHRPASYLSIGAGGCFAAAALAYLVIPDAALNSGGPVGDYLAAVMENRFLFSVLWGGQALAGILALGVIPAVRSAIGTRGAAWMPWLSTLAFLGFGLMAVDFLRYVTLVPFEASAWASSGEAVRQMIAGDFRHLMLDDDLLKYGAVGTWIVGVGLVALRHPDFSSAFTVVAIAAGVGAWGLALEDLVPTDLIEPLAAALAGVTVPVYFSLLGLKLRGEPPGPGKTGERVAI